MLRQVVSYPLRKAITIAGETNLKSVVTNALLPFRVSAGSRVNNIVGSHNLFFCGRDRGQWDETLVSWSSLVPCRKETRRGVGGKKEEEKEGRRGRMKNKKIK